MGFYGLLVSGGSDAAQQTETTLSEQVELARLVDLCAQRLGLNIQYDPNELKGSMTLRLGAGLSDQNLWALANRLLAGRGFTSIQMPGEEAISIVKLNEAGPLARVEASDLKGAKAGFLKILWEPKHRTTDEILPALNGVLSKPGGSAFALGRTDHIVIADLRPHVEQAIDILKLVDVPPGESVTEEIATEHTEPETLIPVVERVASMRSAVLGVQLRGKLVPLAGSGQILLIAPIAERETWVDLIHRLDQPEGLETVSYPPGPFEPAKVGKLLEEVVLGAGAGKTDERWRMVTDELTGSLVVTTTSSRHEKVKAFLEELAKDSPGEAVIEEISAQYVDPAQLVTLVERVASTRAAVMGRPLQGKLLSAPGGRGVLLVAPRSEVTLWRGLIQRLDQRQPVETVSYSPRAFSLSEIQSLIEEVALDPVTQTPGEGWRMIADELTGTLLVTATPSQHLRIKELLERLESAATATRRPMRSFVLKNRNAEDLVELLQNLSGAGALLGPEGGDGQKPGPSGSPPGSIGGTDGQASLSPALDPRAFQGAVPAPQELPPARVQETARPQRRGQAGLATEELSLTADPATNTLIAVGDAALLDNLASLIKTLDVRQPQVMIEVLVATLTDNQTQDLGVELQQRGMSGGSIVDLASLFGLGSPDLGTGTLPAATTGLSAVVLNPGDFSLVVRALETLNEGRSLTIPKVLVNNNQQALLDSVLQTPFASTNASTTVATTSFGGTLDAGTSITITPQIAEGDHLVLKYQVSLSSFTGESADPALPPPRQQNKLQSVATVPDGHVIAVGGLDTQTVAEAVSQVPILGSIPILGRLFQSTSATERRTRLFVFIRANILRRDGFEDLKYLSEKDLGLAALEDGWPPAVEPMLVR